MISIFENLVECDSNYIKLINQTGMFQNFYFWKKVNYLYNDMKLYVNHNSVSKIDKVEYYLREIEEMLSSPTIDLGDAIFLKYYTGLGMEPEKRNQDFEALGRTLEWDCIEELISKMCQKRYWKLDLASIALKIFLTGNKLKEKSPNVEKTFDFFMKKIHFIMNGFSEKNRQCLKNETIGFDYPIIDSPPKRQ